MTSKVRKGASRQYSPGILFEEEDGLYVVDSCVPGRVTFFGPTWDVYLSKAPPELQLANEVMKS